MTKRQLSETEFRTLVRKMRIAQQVYFGLSRAPAFREARQAALIECRKIESRVDAELGITAQVTSGLFSTEGSA